MYVYGTRKCPAEAMLQDVKSWDYLKLIYVVKQSRHAYLLVISSLSKSFVKRSDRSIDGGVSLENSSALKFFLKRKTWKSSQNTARHFLNENPVKPKNGLFITFWWYWTSGMPHFGCSKIFGETKFLKPKLNKSTQVIPELTLWIPRDSITMREKAYPRLIQYRRSKSGSNRLER